MRPLQGLSIFGRTFLLMLAALTIAVGIGLVLIVDRPPLDTAPVSLYEIARRLDSGPRDRRDDGPQFGPGPPGFRDSFGQERGPPPNRDSFRGSPPDPADELTVTTAATPPAPPADVDATASAKLKERLVALMEVNADSVLLYAGSNSVSATRMNSSRGELSLAEGFVAARQLPSGEWRSIVSVAPPFPNAFQKQALLSFVIGLALLVPLSWLFARALAAPIRRFSHAATRLGTDPHAPPLPLEGPPEMLLAVDSFNAMQARLNRLLQERTQMIGAIAHDLRTPLTRLAFRLDDLPAPLSEKVTADINEMKSMISAALDFLRDRTLSVRRERLDFRLLVESVVDDQSDLGHDVTLQSGTPITIVGDPLALRRAVVNLVENAIKYGERARLRLIVADERCTLQIDDDGPGVPEGLHTRVFEPFFRLESSRNRDTGGVGLGLAVVRATVTDHGGEVSLQNRKGNGLRATVWLPLATA